MAVKIVTDSTADLPQEIVERYGITVIPLNVHFGDRVFSDGVDLTAEEFFPMLEGEDELPRTSQPAAGDFAELYGELAEEGDQIVSIHISSKISGTVQSAELAADMVDAEVEVIDSRFVSLGLGMLVIEAVRAVEEGCGKDEVVRRVERGIERVSLYFTVETLEYLYKGGRLSRAQKVVGSILNVKPIIVMEDGEFSVLARARGRRKALRKILAELEEGVGDSPASFAVAHGNVAGEAERWAEELNERFNVEELYVNIIGPVVGTHGGPGALGIFVLRRE